MVRDLLAIVRDGVGADTAQVLAVDHHGGYLVPGEVVGDSRDPGARIRIGTGFAGRIADDRKARLVSDVSRTARSELDRSDGAGALAAVPLVVTGVVVGVLQVATRTPDTFDQGTIDRLQQLTMPVAAAVERRRAAEAERRRARESAALAEVSRQFQQPGAGAEDGLRRAVRSAAEQLDAACAVLLPGDGRFEVRAAWRRPGRDQDGVRRIAGSLDVPLEGGLVGDVHATGEPLVFQDLTPERFRTVARGRFDPLVDLLRPSAVALVPVRTAGRPIGVLVTIRGPHPLAHSRFDEAELAFLQDLADRVALGIDAERSTAERRAAEAALRASEARFRSAFDDAPLGAAVTEGGAGGFHRLVRVNEQLCALLGYDPEALVQQPYRRLVHRDDVERFEAAMAAARAAPDRTIDLELRFVRSDGTPAWVRVVSSPIGEAGVSQRIWHIEDVTLEREAREELTRLALYDGVTGLANRNQVIDRLGMALHQLDRRPGAVGLVYVDLDRFKAVNDTFGHEAGDQVLQESGRRIREAVRAADTPARLAGDEFVVLCPDVHDEHELAGVAERVTEALRLPMLVHGREIVIGASAGVTLTRSPGTTADELLRQGDAAMYRAKRRGGRSWEVYADPGPPPARRPVAEDERTAPD